MMQAVGSDGKLSLILYCSLEFAEEADIVLKVEAEILDLPFEHGDALHTHSESESGVLLGVDAAGFQYVGVNHAGTHNLQPAGALADIAALAAADVAADVHLCAGLGEGEVGGTHADLGVRAEHLAHEDQNRLLEVGEGYVFVNVQALYLVEDAVGAGRDGLVADTWWKMQWARAEMASLRNTLPGHITRIGGLRFSIVLTCTELVWVRRRTGLTPEEMKNVSCMSLAGWSGGKLRASKTWWSSSISGPSAIGAFRQGIALLAEDGDDLLAGDGYGMAGAQLEVVSGHGHVEGGGCAFG